MRTPIEPEPELVCGQFDTHCLHYKSKEVPIEPNAGCRRPKQETKTAHMVECCRCTYSKPYSFYDDTEFTVDD